ncbi:hypothetical protein RCL1_004393 [Eukaryota sp. TZLM3-RCL]
MAIGKNKKLGKKGGRKKIVDAFAKKEWYDVQAPSMFINRAVGKTVVSKTAGLKLSSDALKGRVIETHVADLNRNDDQFRKIKLRIEDVSGKTCLTNFHGMEFTTDRLKSLVKKWHTMIEAHLDVRTTDGYVLRLFCVGFTASQKNQVKRTTYAQSAQVHLIRSKMLSILKTVGNVDLKEFVNQLVSDKLTTEITKVCQRIYPLQNVCIRKVKVVRAPKFDAAKLLELHHTKAAEVAPVVAEAPVAEAPVAEVTAEW